MFIDHIIQLSKPQCDLLEEGRIVSHEDKTWMMNPKCSQATVDLDRLFQ
jgi:hypothetical protein